MELTDDERAELGAMLRRGRAAARRLTRARVLLSAAEGRLDQDIAAAVRCGERTVQRVRRRFVEGGLEHALSERPRPGAERLLDARAEAHQPALSARGRRTVGRAWTMRLLADRLVRPR